MKIIDNFLSETYFKNISELMSGGNFKWRYYDIKKSFGRSSKSKFNEYGFSYVLSRPTLPNFSSIAHEEIDPVLPFIQPLLYQILDATDCDFILRARADMVTWSGKEDYIYQPHIDFPFPNTAAVFYVNESDGDTIFYNIKPEQSSPVQYYQNLEEYERVSPKVNRLVLFDGDSLHTGCSPTKHKNRILINSNFIKSENVEEYQKYYGQEF